METSIRPELAHQRFVEMDTCADWWLCQNIAATAAKVCGDYYGVADGAPTLLLSISMAGVTNASLLRA